MKNYLTKTVKAPKLGIVKIPMGLLLFSLQAREGVVYYLHGRKARPQMPCIARYRGGSIGPLTHLRAFFICARANVKNLWRCAMLSAWYMPVSAQDVPDCLENLSAAVAFLNTTSLLDETQGALNEQERHGQFLMLDFIKNTLDNCREALVKGE